MSPTLRETRAQRNAALARSRSSTGYVVNVRHWHLADICFRSAHALVHCICPLLTQSGHQCLSAWCPKGQFILRRVDVKIGGLGEHGG